MAVRIVGVEVVDGDPVEPRAKVRLHAAHQVSGEGLEVADLGRVLCRNDEAELMAIVSAARLEPLGVGRVGHRSVSLAGLTLRRHTIALDVAQVRGRRSGRGLGQNDQPGLDHHPPVARTDPVAEQPRGGSAASALEPSAGRAANARSNGAAGLLSRLQHLAGEPPRAGLAASRLGWPWPEPVLIREAGHACSGGSCRTNLSNPRTKSLCCSRAWRVRPPAWRRPNRCADKALRAFARCALLSCPHLHLSVFGCSSPFHVTEAGHPTDQPHRWNGRRRDRRLRWASSW